MALTSLELTDYTLPYTRRKSLKRSQELRIEAADCSFTLKYIRHHLSQRYAKVCKGEFHILFYMSHSCQRLAFLIHFVGDRHAGFGERPDMDASVVLMVHLPADQMKRNGVLIECIPILLTLKLYSLQNIYIYIYLCMYILLFTLATVFLSWACSFKWPAEPSNFRRFLP